MYPNLDAEQARYRDTNQMVADFLGISRIAYENKKKSGKFTAPQIARLCEKYGVKFEYLFAEHPTDPAFGEAAESA